MAIQGEFRDGGLTSIVQMMCLDCGDVALFVEGNGEKGEIFFEAGEIVHANVGKLDGAEALYRMLAWAEGTFLTAEQAQAPRITITLSWDQLLMDGQRWVEEQNQAVRQPISG